MFTTEVFVSGDAPFRIVLTPRTDYTPLFRIEGGEKEFDASWIPSLIEMLEEARKISEDFVPPKKKRG